MTENPDKKRHFVRNQEQIELILKNINDECPGIWIELPEWILKVISEMVPSLLTFFIFEFDENFRAFG